MSDKTEIVLSRDLHLPMTAATQTFAALGKRGSGKTYGVGRLVEEMLRVDIQVVVLDAIGNWYGLRLKRDGITPSDFNIPILGGHRGDVALLPDAGELVARTLAETGSSGVLDVSLFRKHQRKQFATDFAEELLHLKKTASTKTRLFLVLEESQLYIPQRTMKGEERMLGAFEDLVKLGRNYGIGVALISQRPQAVNKDVLNQTEVLMVFQMAGRHERDAVEAWISEKDIEDQALNLVEEIPSLDVGTAFVWSPSWLRVFVKTKILEKRTFDASAIPDQDDVETGTLTPLDLGALRQAMRTVEDRAAEDDPKRLRARIQELEHSVTVLEEAKADNLSDAAWSSTAADAELEELRHRVEEMSARVVGLEETLDRAKATDQAIRSAYAQLRAVLERMRETLEGLEGVDDLPPSLEVPATFYQGEKEARRFDLTRGSRIAMTETAHARRGPAPPLNRDRAADLSAPLKPRPAHVAPGLKGGARRMLEIAAAFPAGLSKRALSTFAGVIMGGTFSDYLSILRTRGLITTSDGEVEVLITAAGAEHVISPIRPSLRYVLDLHLPKLKGGAKRMLEILVDVRGAAIEKKELSEKSGVKTGGTFSDYLSILRTRGLIEESGSRIRASDLVFGRGERAK